MPPKRREKEVESSKSVKAETTGDNELFLNAFEKPSQIYRYLRDRSDCKPYFLRRTLFYMQHRRSRKKRVGKKITADTLLEHVLDKLKSDLKTSGYLTLTYLGVFNQWNKQTPKEPVKLETILLKMCHQKRKELCRSVQLEQDDSLSSFCCSDLVNFPCDNILVRDSVCYHQVPFGTSYVVFNPPLDNPPPKVPSVSIPAENFHLNGSKVKPYTILLRITTNPSEYLKMTSNPSEDSEPKPKKIKLSKESNESSEFGMELVVYDKHQRCSLEDGIYEFVLGELENRSNNEKCARISAPFSTWEDLKEDKENVSNLVHKTGKRGKCRLIGQNQLTEITKRHFDSFENMTKGPTLQFQLKWTKEASKPIVDRPPTFNAFSETNQSNGDNNNVPEGKHPEQTKTIVYQFSCNNKLSSETETAHDLICPWCFLDCKFIYSLLWHLKLCHPRFNFQFTQMSNGMKIDVSVNESYDGSYAGCPTMPFRPGWPMKRTSLTHVVVCHPKRTKTKSLSEFTEIEENDHENHRPYITGHNRLYHHSTTCLPINPKEIDVDSEDEMDPWWLKQKVVMMIDDFTDVNEGEKEIMKMWNLHAMKHGSVFVGACQLPMACSMFVEEKGEELLRKNLYRNFVLFLNSLHDFGLISPVTIFQVTQKLQALIQIKLDIKKQLQEGWQLQKQHWNAVEQKPVVDVSESAKSPGMSGNPGDSGQRRKPNSEKKPTPKKASCSSVTGKDKKGKQQPDAKRQLSLSTKPELRKKSLKETPTTSASSSANSSSLRRRSVTVEQSSAKKKSDVPE